MVGKKTNPVVRDMVNLARICVADFEASVMRDIMDSWTHIVLKNEPSCVNLWRK